MSQSRSSKRDDKAALLDMLRMFEGIESNEDAIPVLGDVDAMKVLAAWTKTDQRWTTPRAKPPAFTTTTHAACWEWVVSGWTIDHAAVSRACGLPIRAVVDKLKMLVALRLMYPTGALSRAARVALQLHVSKTLGLKAKKNPDAAKDVKGDN